MKIIQFISHYLPASRYGGPQQVAHGLARALIAAGHDVTVLTTNLEDEQADLAVPLGQPQLVDGVTVLYFATRWSRYWGYAPQMRAASEKLVATADLVLVHFHYQFANWLGARMARKYAKPYVLFAHGSFKKDAIQRRSRHLKSWYLAGMENQNLRSASLTVFNAVEERDMSRFADRGIVLPNAINPHDFIPRPESGTFRREFPELDGKTVFLFLGRLDYRGKGLDMLLPAFAQLLRFAPDVRLVLAGPDERNGLRDIKRAVESLSISPYVVIPGMLTGARKLAAQQDADAFLLPSRSEGLSIALLEALYLGLPVLITDQVGLHQRVRESNAGVVVPANESSITQGLSQIASEEVRSSMKGRAVDWITRDYTWPAVARQLFDQLQHHQQFRRACP